MWDIELIIKGNQATGITKQIEEYTMPAIKFTEISFVTGKKDISLQ
jgi:hypothetical protein